MLDNNTETKFQSVGSLTTPGPLGRIVRLFLGIGCLYFVWQLLNLWPSMVKSEKLFSNGSFLFMTIFGLYLIPYVINIGWKLNTKRRPQFLIIIISATFIIYNYYSTGQVSSNLFNTLTILWLFYIFLHLGLSFVISASIATPGCEMRGIPHLFSKLTGNTTYEHSCPGHLDKLDKWESRK